LHTNYNNDSNTDFEAALHFEPTSRSVPKQFGSPITSMQNTIDLLYERIKFSLKKKKSGLYAIEMTYNLSNTHKTNKQTKIRKRQFMAKYCVYPIQQGALFNCKNARKLRLTRPRRGDIEFRTLLEKASQMPLHIRCPLGIFFDALTLTVLNEMVNWPVFKF